MGEVKIRRFDESCGARIRFGIIGRLAEARSSTPGLLLLKHAGRASVSMRWTLTAVISGLVMVESGFTPAALSLLAAAGGSRTGRGAAMGIHSFLLSVGALAGRMPGGLLGQRFAIDGLIYATSALVRLALGLLTRLEPARVSA